MGISLSLSPSPPPPFSFSSSSLPPPFLFPLPLIPICLRCYWSQIHGTRAPGGCEHPPNVSVGIQTHHLEEQQAFNCSTTCPVCIEVLLESTPPLLFSVLKGLAIEHAHPFLSYLSLLHDSPKNLCWGILVLYLHQV